MAVLLEAGARKPSITAASSVSAVDHTSAMVRWLESELARAPSSEVAARLALDAEAAAGAGFPFDHAITFPLTDPRGRHIAVLALLGAARPSDPVVTLLVQLCETAAHALWAHRWRRMVPPGLLSRRNVLLAGLAVAVLAFVPVPMTVLAPVEVIADQPLVVAAPMPGVVARIEIDPDQPVAVGDVLFTYEQSELRSARDIALRKAETAGSRLRTIEQEALRSQSGARELAELRAEQALAAAELARAEELLSKAVVRADQSGVALHAGKEEWSGKPVQTGEKVVEIADPAHFRFRIDLAASDSILLSQDAAVRIFLDANPLSPVDAIITSRSYRAQRSADGRMAHALNARLAGKAWPGLRIGLRGSARITGGNVSLAFLLFRRPFTALRQFTGL
jgi:hypothetical protein